MDITDCVIVSKHQLDNIERMLRQLLSLNNNIKLSSPPPEYLTEEEVIKMLGVTKSTLCSWKSRGKIPYHKPEGNKRCKTYYKYSDIVAFQQGIKHKSNSELEAEADDYIMQNRK